MEAFCILLSVNTYGNLTDLIRTLAQVSSIVLSFALHLNVPYL